MNEIEYYTKNLGLIRLKNEISSSAFSEIYCWEIEKYS